VLTKPVKTKEALDETFARLKRFIEPHDRRALVVESDPERQRAVCGQVAADGVEVVCAASAAEASETLRDGRGVDLIVTGIDLSDKPGFDFVDEVKEDPASSTTTSATSSR
jgi:CheY-like chemotaxis protein